MRDILTRYPELAPYKGCRWSDAVRAGCGLFVIGESHYLPAESTCHLKCDMWYEGSHDSLSEKERGWIDTASLIGDDINNGRFQKEHSIYIRGAEAINQFGPRFEKDIQIFDYICFFNYFLRPAENGKSLSVDPKDVDFANNRLKTLYDELRPDGVLFLSRKAYDCAIGIRDKLGLCVVGVPHPASQWWNRRAKKYGMRKGRDVVSDVVLKLPWDNLRQ